MGSSSYGVWALVAPWHVKSFKIRDQTHAPCIGRQILFFLGSIFFFFKLSSHEMGGCGLTRLSFISETANSGHISRWITVTHGLSWRFLGLALIFWRILEMEVNWLRYDTKLFGSYTNNWQTNGMTWKMCMWVLSERRALKFMRIKSVTVKRGY